MANPRHSSWRLLACKAFFLKFFPNVVNKLEEVRVHTRNSNSLIPQE